MGVGVGMGVVFIVGCGYGCGCFWLGFILICGLQVSFSKRATNHRALLQKMWVLEGLVCYSRLREGVRMVV